MLAEPSPDMVHQLLEHSLGLLLRHDSYLLEKDVNERSISHRLALYLQELFEAWNVDCEYNRDHDDSKRLKIMQNVAAQEGVKVEVDDTNASTVFPDIIVHRRGTDDNLLVIEMKKTTSRGSDKFDRCKLNEFRHQLGYRYAVFIKLRTGGSEVGIEEMDWIQDHCAE